MKTKSPMSFNSLLFNILIFPLILILVSCQYQFGRGEFDNRYSTISVPYIEADQRGELTANVIKKISTSTSLRYVSCGGDLILKIKLLDFAEENIGYRHDRKKTGELKKNIIPTQTRVKGIAEVILVEAATNKTLKGPLQISATAEFDHTFYFTWDEINIFSLSQLNDIDAAREAVLQPLYRNLAERIVDDVVNE